MVGNIMGGIANAFLSSYGNERSFGGFFVVVAICVFIGAYCVLYSSMETLWERAKSKILKDSVGSYIFTNIIAVGAIVILAGIATGIANSGYRAGGDGEGAFFLVLLLLLWFGCLIYSIILRYRIYKEVAYITNQPLFLMAFWLGVTIFLLPIAVIVYIIAWIMVKEIRKSMSAGEYESESEKSGSANSASIIIALVLVAIIGGIVIAVAVVTVPKYKVARMDAQVATARSDLASAQKAIIAKVFAANIDVKKPKAPNPNPLGADYIEWGEWIMEVAGLDSARWRASSNGVYAIDNSKRKACYDRSGLPVLWIDTNNGNMVFNPSKLSDSYDDGFCEKFSMSYKSSGGLGDKVIPLESTGTVEF